MADHASFDDPRDDAKPELQRYLAEIGRYKTLTATDEAALFVLFKAGNEDALAEFVRSHLALVVRVARSLTVRGVPFIDLIDMGNVGLVRAALKFDPGSTLPFISYAIWWIRQALLQAIHHGLRADSSIASSGGVPDHSWWVTLLSQARRPVAQPVVDLPETDQDFESALNETVNKAIARLPPIEARVISLYFGLEAEPVTLNEIASATDLEIEEVIAIKQSALQRLREQSGGSPEASA